MALPQGPMNTIRQDMEETKVPDFIFLESLLGLSNFNFWEKIQLDRIHQVRVQQ